MKFLNLGVQELVFVFLLIILIMGPNDLANTARKIGRFIYRLRKSPTFMSIMKTSDEIRRLPNKLIREAGIEETLEETKAQLNPIMSETGDSISNTLKDTSNTLKETGSAQRKESGWLNGGDGG